MANISFTDLPNGLSETLGDEVNARFNAIKGAVNAMPTNRATWNSATAYVANDLVRYNGSTWLCLVDNTNVQPIEGATWTVFAQKGDSGIANIPDASAVIKGVVKLSVAPVVAVNPVALGVNDPIVAAVNNNTTAISSNATALAAKAPINSPALTDTPTAPTPAAGDVSTRLATTSFVDTRVATLINAAPSALDTLGELAAQLANDESAASSLTTTVAGKLAKASNLSDLIDVPTARTSLGLNLVTTLLGAVARSVISVAGTTKGTRRQINFIPGTGISIDAVDDAPNEKTDVTITATGGGGGGTADGSGFSQVTVTAGGSIVESGAESILGNREFIGTPAAAVTYVVGTTPRAFFVKNSTSQIITVKTNTGTGIAVAAGTIAHLDCDGTNVVAFTSGTGSSGARTQLSATRTYYVSPTGNNSNDGLSAGAPFLTPQKALDLISTTLDLSIYDVTIQVADGTYAGNIVLRPLVGNGGKVIIQGNATTPANVLLTATSGVVLNGKGSGINYTLKDFKITNTGGQGIRAASNAVISIQNIEFGTCSAEHFYIDGGAHVTSFGYKITGGATSHIRMGSQARFISSTTTVTIVGSPNFSSTFMTLYSLSLVDIYAVTWSGALTATGSVYVAANCLVNTYGAVNVPGGASSILPGGQYV